MRITKAVKNFAVALACVGLLGGQIAQAAPPIQDVALQPGGKLVGQIVSAEAVPQARVRMAVVANGEAVATTTTDEEGRFEVRGLKAGVYGIQTSQSGSIYRAWAPETAPPAAVEQVMVVNDGTVVRGNWHNHFAWLANPWVLAAIVAAAIAIPLAVDGDAS